MADEVVVHEHAYKHGILKDDILHAWRNAYANQTRTGLYPPQHLLAGPDRRSRDLQLACVWDDDDQNWVVFHAMPLTNAARRELGLRKRGQDEVQNRRWHHRR